MVRAPCSSVASTCSEAGPAISVGSTSLPLKCRLSASLQVQGLNLKPFCTNSQRHGDERLRFQACWLALCCPCWSSGGRQRAPKVHCEACVRT